MKRCCLFCTCSLRQVLLQTLFSAWAYQKCDYVAWLDDRKWAYVRLEGRAFGDVPLNLEYKLEVWDSPNSAGIIIDALRAAKIAKDRGIGGPILSASSYFMKSPPEQYDDATARDAVEKFIHGELER